jgi:hypothetical protein
VSFRPEAMGPPVRHHRVGIVNAVQWIEGDLEALGNPHDFVNQDDLDMLTVAGALVTPWAFTGLPNSRVDRLIVRRASVQILTFNEEATLAEYREPPSKGILVFNLPLVIVRGSVPVASEARPANALDFWRRVFYPVTDAQIHYLARTEATPPASARLVYVNRAVVQSYRRA